MRLVDRPARDPSGNLHVVVESPRGATVKLVYEPELDAFTLGRPLALGVVYPYDWGFVPGTRAPDGDPVDAMVLFEGATAPGVVHVCRALGTVRLTQDDGHGGRERNDRIIAVPVAAPRLDGVRDARDLPERLRDELACFFVAATALEHKGVAIEGWGGPDDASALVAEGERRSCEGGSKTS